MKIVFVEPNLKVTSGHVFEAMRSLRIYLSDQSKEIETGYVCHQSADSRVLTAIPSIKPLYKLSCFELGRDQDVIDSLANIITEFNLDDSDAVVFTTAHLRDIACVNKLVEEKGTPRFVMQLHQYYPPFPDSDVVMNTNVNNEIAQQYKKIFNDIDQMRVTVITTPITTLSDKIEATCHYRPANFPVPFSPILFDSKHNHSNLTTIGFLGDGRKEKGLLEFLRLAETMTRSENKFRFLVQIQNPRGFSEPEAKEINDLMEVLSSRIQVTILNGPLDTHNYYDALKSCDIVCVLHHPDHYSIRLSGIAVECGMIGIPVIARAGTCISAWIDGGKLSGRSIVSGDISSLYTAVMEIENERSQYDPVKASKEWRYEYSPENYINNYLLPLLNHECK